MALGVPAVSCPPFDRESRPGVLANHHPVGTPGRICRGDPSEPRRGDAASGRTALAGDRPPRQVLIVGGSSGIGRALVQRFARGGDHVWFTYRSERQPALTLVTELAVHGWQAEAFEFDQGNWASHECLLQQLPGPVDVLVNNAAASYRTIEDLVTGPDHRREAALLWINTGGPLWLIRQLLPGMIEQGYGTIVTVAGGGDDPAVQPGLQLADGMSRAALAYLTEHLAAELAQQPIGVFAICPGTVAPDLQAPNTLASLPDQRSREPTATPPFGRLSRPAEIAEAVWWLAQWR